MESLRERTETWTFRCCVDFKMENMWAFQLAQQKAICGRTVMSGSVLDQLQLPVGT
jgi:hypothetical protein